MCWESGIRSTWLPTFHSLAQDTFGQNCPGQYPAYPDFHRRVLDRFDERAAYLEKGRLPSEFPCFGSICQYWHGYCFICSLTHNRKQFNIGDHLMLVDLGSSFALEYAVRGAYESTIGKLSERTSGNEFVDEDAYAARVAREYAWIENAPESLFGKYPHIRKVKELGRGSHVVSIPRYQEFSYCARIRKEISSIVWMA
jgi:hypothetical protein